jgi:hypothetical protein
LEADSAAYFGLDFRYSNDKLKATGYRFRYPEAREGVREVLGWYAREGWLDRAPQGMDRHRYETMARACNDELDGLMRSGTAPALESIAGWEFRGYNTLPLTGVLGFRKFKKGFYRDERGVAGYNVAVKGGPLSAPWVPRTRDGYPIRHALFRVEPAPGRDRECPYPSSLLIDYAQGANPTYDPSRLLRDYLAQPYPDDADLLLGKAYLDLGLAKPAVSYFVLGRDGPSVKL